MHKRASHFVCGMDETVCIVQLPRLHVNIVVEDMMNLWDVLQKSIPSPHATDRIENDGKGYVNVP
jgi:hypothetical protein